MNKEEFERKADRNGLLDYLDLDGDSVGIAMVLDIVNGAVSDTLKDAVLVCERHAGVYAALPKTLTTDVAWAACIDIRDALKRKLEEQERSKCETH